MNEEALFIASGQNVKRLLAFGGRRAKKLAPPQHAEEPRCNLGLQLVMDYWAGL